MAKKNFRDIQAGVDAAELYRGGHLGRELERVAFLFADNGVKDAVFDSENEAYEKMVDLLARGVLVSAMVSASAHAFSEEDAEAFEVDFRSRIDAGKPAFERRIAADAMGEPSGNDEAIKRLAAEIPEAAQALLACARQAGAINREEFELLQVDVRSLADKGDLSGFAYVEKGVVKAFVSAYPPSVWKKWQQLKEADVAVSPLMTGMEGGAGRNPAERIANLRDRLCGLYAADWIEEASAYV